MIGSGAGNWQSGPTDSRLLQLSFLQECYRGDASRFNVGIRQRLFLLLRLQALPLALLVESCTV